MNKHPYLSICIPTYQRIEITRNTIKSIYADLEGVDLCDFEVIVSGVLDLAFGKKTIQNSRM